MTKAMFVWVTVGMVVGAGVCRPVAAQGVEQVGERALGMGGAFVAVANDSSATWWNPGALATGPFVDASVGRASVGRVEQLPAARAAGAWWAMTIPSLGLSYYRTHIASAAPLDSTAQGAAGRQEEGADVPIQFRSASQFGVTVGQTVGPGLHVGTTLKYVRGTVRTGRGPGGSSPSMLLDQAGAMTDGLRGGGVDLDVGLMAARGPIRVGATVRNVRQISIRSAARDVMLMPRVVRVGAALDAAASGGPPMIVSMDVDLRTYVTETGARRVVAVGAERWLRESRLGVRGGVRVNTVGARERAVTAGLSVAVRSGIFLEGHVVGGGSADERGWGAAARVSF